MIRDESTSTTDDINTGTLAGFNAFCMWLVQRGGMKSGAVDPLRSATNQILVTVDGDAAASLDLRALDTDDYLGRFENKAGHKYSPNSLRAYSSRFSRSVDLYRQFLDQGAANFRPPPGRSTRRRATSVTAQQESVSTASASGTSSGAQTHQALVDFPFPLKSGYLAHLYLPQLLEKDDAERMATFIRALVSEPQRQLGPSSEPSL
jgi:hypothetical protein